MKQWVEIIILNSFFDLFQVICKVAKSAVEDVDRAVEAAKVMEKDLELLYFT